MKLVNNKITKVIFAVGALCTAQIASAEILQYTFTHANKGTMTSVQPMNAIEYISTSNQIEVAASAGLDQKIRISIINSENQIINQRTGTVISATDRITINGRSYYGEKILIPAPTAGKYTVKQEILSTSNTVIESSSKGIHIDTTAPTIGGLSGSSTAYGQVISGDVWKLGRSSSGLHKIYADNVGDNTEIKEAFITVYREDGSVYQQKSIDYDVVLGKVGVRYTSGLFPNSDLDELFTIKITAVDIAGNEYSKSQKVYFDNIANPPSEPYAVYDPTATSTLIDGHPGIVKYKAGMTVKTNPIQLVYKLPKTNWHKYREGGLNLVNIYSAVEEIKTDDEYTYIHLSAPYGNTNGNNIRWSNFGTWGGAPSISYNLTLDPDAPKTPVIKRVEYKFSDIGWSDYRHYFVKNDRLPLHVTNVRITAEPRAFEQTFSHSGASCVIPVNEASCEAPFNAELNLGTTGYLHGASHITNADKTLKATNTWAEVHWNDLHYPDVTANYDEKTKKITAFINQPGRGAYFDRLNLKDVWLIDGEGNRLDIPGRKIEEIDQNFVYEWSMQDLPGGTFDISVVAEENHGPTSTEFAARIVSDRTKPTVSINILGESNTISSLDEVTITAFDEFSDIEFQSIRLQGGPVDEDVYLASRKLSGQNQYGLLYPVLFPSSNVSENYTLTVTVKDKQGNESTASKSINYQPPQVTLENNRAIKIPNIKTQIRRESGEQLIHSKVLKLGDGTTVRGVYPVYATLRSDAVASIKVHGVTIEPGETKTITDAYDFDSNAGRFNLSLEPTTTEKAVKGSLLIGSTAPNSPVLVANFSFLDFHSNINVNTEPMAVVEELKATLSLGDSSESFCHSLTLVSEDAINSDLFSNPICLVTYKLSAARKKATSSGNSTSLSAYMPSLSHELLHINVSAFGYNNRKIDLAEYEYKIEPKNPEGIVKSSLNINYDTILHKIELVEATAQFSSFSGCEITGDRDVAMLYAFDKTDTNSVTKCYLEWSRLPKGITQVGNSVKISGYAEELDQQVFEWSLSVFHNVDEKLILSSGALTSQVVVPETPSLISTTLNYDNGKSTTGASHLLRDSNAKVKNIQFNVEPRNFAQVVKFKDSFCTVPKDLDSCRIDAVIGPLGNQGADKKGSVSLKAAIDSSISYFEERNQGAFTHNLNWDYTPPRLEKVLINNKRDGSTLTENINGTDISLSEDEAAIVIYSPFTNINDKSWMLKNPYLYIKSDDEITYEQSVLIDKNIFYFIHDKVNLDEDNRVSPQNVDVYGNYIVYRYSFDGLPDGAFKFDLNLRDEYKNGADYEHDTFIMQRTAPKIKLSYLRDKANMVDGIYFASDFGAVANPGWDKMNTITEATFGGERLTLVDDAANPRSNVKFFQGSLSTLTAGDSYPLVIKAVDTAGNVGEFSQEFIYAPSTFNIKSQTGSVELYQKVQRGTAYVSQSRYLCNYVGSKDLAQEVSRESRKGCYVEIDSLPNGMTSIWQGWALKVTGSILDISDREIEYSAYVVNPDGQEVRVSNETLIWDVKPAEQMTLNLSPIIPLDKKVYGIIPENPALARYTLENVAGEVNINVNRGKYSDSKFMPQRSHKAIYKWYGVLRDDDVDKRNVFDRYPLDIEAAYNLSPQDKADTNGEVIVLPSRKVALNLSMESNDVILSTDKVAITTYLGEWNWQEKNSHYDASKMGVWDVYLAYKDNKGNEQRITETKTNESNGEVHFELNIEDIFRKTSGIYAVASVQSPHPEYKQTLTSTPIFMRIVLGSGVSGNLESSVVSGKVPFTTLVRYDYDTIEDMVASNDTIWQKSIDKVHWENLDKFKDRSSIPFFVTEAGDYFVRARVTNKNTNETTLTDPLKISGYDKANLIISGPTQVYEGQEMHLQMKDRTTDLSSYDGIAQWSRDEGKTWFNGTPNQTLIASGEKEVILGRFKYKSSTAGAGDDAWAKARFYARPVGPRNVMARIQTNHLVELGVPFDIEAKVINFNGGVDLPIVYEWIKPNGETSNDIKFTYTPNESDLNPQGRLNFILRAWVKGYKEQTFKETQRSLETWKYEFPEMNIGIRSNILVAPSVIVGMIQMKRSYMPGISYEYEWLENEDIEVRTPNKMYSEITLKTPGVHELQAKVTDSRGMTRIISHYVDVIEPDETEGSFMYFPSNSYNRAPLGLVARAKMTGGHPKDYIIDYKWYVNGVEQENMQSRSPMYRFEIEEPGEYEIKAVTTSQYGQVTEIVENYTVNENSIPVCNSEQNIRSGTIRITANCKDNDGYVIGYDWWFNGEYVGRGASSTQLRLSEFPSMTVRYEAIDDAGGRTTGSFSW